MTKQEAIKILEKVLKKNIIYDENEAFEFSLALEMAIEALEQSKSDFTKCNKE